MGMMKKVSRAVVWLAASYALMGNMHTLYAEDLQKSWTSVGSAGTILTNPTYAKLSSTALYVKKPTGSKTPIVVSIIYNIVPVDGALCNLLESAWVKVRYRDPGKYSRVKVSIKRLDLNSGAQTLFSILDSDTRAQSNSFQTFSYHNCGTAWLCLDFTNHAWYVQVDMSYADNNEITDQSPAIQAIQIGTKECQN